MFPGTYPKELKLMPTQNLNMNVSTFIQNCPSIGELICKLVCTRQKNIQFSSVVQSFSRVWFCDPMNLSMPGLPVHNQLPEFTQTHVHWVSDAIQPSHPLLSPSPAVNLSQHQGLFHWVSSSHEVAKYWSFSFSISPSNEYPGLTSFRMDWLDLIAFQGTLKSLLQHHSSTASILRRSGFFIVQLSHPYMATGKAIALTRRTCVGKVMSLLFNMMSRLVKTFLSRSKRLLISWLPSPPLFPLFPHLFPWCDGTRGHDLSFLNVEL